MVNGKIEGKATLIHVEPKIDYAFRDWMDNLVNENMEAATSLTHVERENEPEHVEVREKGITQENNSVSKEGENMVNSRRDKEELNEEMNAGESESDGGYKKELTLIVELVGEDYITMMELLRGIKDKCVVISRKKAADK